MTHSITLVSHALCPYVQRIAIVLAEKGVPHERITVETIHSSFRVARDVVRRELPAFAAVRRCSQLELVAMLEHPLKTNRWQMRRAIRVPVNRHIEPPHHLVERTHVIWVVVRQENPFETATL